MMKMTKAETIAYFKELAYHFEVKAHRAENPDEKNRYSGKSEAYKIAAFELEHNMK